MMGFPSFEDWKAEQTWDEESFNAERAMKLLYQVRKDLYSAKESRASLSTKLREAESELERLEDADVSGQVSKLTKERDEALRSAAARLKYEVGIKAGLSYTQAKRLAGETVEELEADVEDLRKDLGLDKSDGSDEGGDGGDSGDVDGGDADGDGVVGEQDGAGQGQGFIGRVVRADGRSDRADGFDFDNISNDELDKLIPWSRI